MTFDMNRLPNEILINIIAQIEDRDDLPEEYRANLSALSLISKRFHVHVEPYLYTEFNCSPLFLRSLLEHPHLRPYVQSLEESYGPYFPPDDPADRASSMMWKSRVNNHDLLRSVIAAFANDADLGEKLFTKHYCGEKFVKRYKKGDDEPPSLLLLYLLPNLTSIHVSETYSTRDLLGPFFARTAALQAAGSPHPLSCLRKLSFVNQVSSQHVVLWHILPFLSSPALTYLKICCFHDCEPHENAPRKLVIENASPVRDLVLKGTNCSDESLVTFMRNFRGLRSFEWDNVWHGIQSDGYEFMGAAVREGLVHVRGCLETLVIHEDLSQQFMWSDDDNMVRVPPETEGDEKKLLDIKNCGGFAAFEALSRMDVSATVLLGREYGKDARVPFTHYAAGMADMWLAGLPVSLEHLILRDCCEDIFDALRVLVVRAAETSPPLPNLKTVLVIIRSEIVKQETPIPWSQLVDDFRERGLQIYIMADHSMRNPPCGLRKICPEMDMLQGQDYGWALKGCNGLYGVKGNGYGCC